MYIIYPKKDYQSKIDLDKKYLSDLQELDKAYFNEIENPKTYLIKKAEYRVKRYDLVNQIMTVKKMIEDYENHYKHVFLPTYELQLEETKNNWDVFIKQAQESNNADIKNVLDFYKDHMQDIEIKNMVYQKVRAINDFSTN